MKLLTPRLFIRPVEIKDADALFAYKSQKEITAFQGKSFDKLADIIELIISNPKEINIENSWYQLVLVEQETNTAIGDIGLHFIGPENKQLELGITIAPNAQGKGYAKEAIKAVVEYSFKELNKHRIIASIDPENIPSVKLFESLKFRKEAHFKQSYYQNGIWKDDLIFAMLKTEHDTN